MWLPANFTVEVLDSSGQITNQYPCFDVTTIADTLQAAGVSQITMGRPKARLASYLIRTPRRHQPSQLNRWTNVFPETQFKTDATAGTASVSWLVSNFSEHLRQRLRR